MECKNKQKNLAKCPCTYEPCDKKGLCCECIAFHLAQNELPACCFSEETEKTFDRSFARFIKDNS